MPGLFGLIRLLSDVSLAPEHARARLAAMERPLRCSPAEELESVIQPQSGFAVARLGLPAHRHHAWPGSRGPRSLFVSGLLHADALAFDEAARRFAESGAGPVTELRGFFAAVFADASGPRRFELVTDRHASWPIFYAVIHDTLYFAPEVKALLALPELPRAPDPAALAFMLSGGQLLNTQTLLAAVRRLGGGERLVVEDGRWRVEPYWSYQPRSAGDGTSARDLEHELAHAIRAAVARNLADPEATIILLSGGRDSRAILAAAHEAVGGCGERLRTATWAFDAERSDSDPATAARVAAAIGAAHRVQPMPLAAYAEQFDELLWRADALSDFPAKHPYELALTRELAQRGARVLLRGDECFGWRHGVADVVDALQEVGIRRLSNVDALVDVLRPAAAREWCAAGDAACDELERRYAGWHPDDAKDEAYFRHRLQGYLNPLAYVKHGVIDHRNPLLDEAILDVMQRVPFEERVEKMLFRRTSAVAFHALWGVPFSAGAQDVDWAQELARDSAARRFVEHQFADQTSPAWEWIDRAKLCRVLAALGGGAPRGAADCRNAGTAARFRGAARLTWRGVLRAALRHATPLERRVRRHYRLRASRPESLVLRVLVLKAWFDRLEGRERG
ncbi:MAG: asparagine synthase-related protein [Phycisphaerae bacterium]